MLTKTILYGRPGLARLDFKAIPEPSRLKLNLARLHGLKLLFPNPNKNVLGCAGSRATVYPMWKAELNV